MPELRPDGTLPRWCEQMKAAQIAREAHARQFDRAGQPYIGHLQRVVANLLRRWPDATDAEIAAAWLHDVVEDSHLTGWSVGLLRAAGISPVAVGFVMELTRPDDMQYLAWIRRLALNGTISAVRIKLADLEDNSSPERVAAIKDGSRLLKQRYLPAKLILEQRVHGQ